MSTRNRLLRIAALLAAASYLLLAARYWIELGHLSGSRVKGGYVAAAGISLLARLIGTAGWLLVARAFRAEIDWRGLRRGAAIVVLSYLLTFAATVYDLLPTLADDHGPIRGFYVWTTVAALLIAVGAILAAWGLARPRRGTARAARLQLGLVLAGLSAVAGFLAELAIRSYFAERHYEHRFSAGSWVLAASEAGIALATLALAGGIRFPLERREARVVLAAGGAALATFLGAVGEGLVASGYAAPGAPSWESLVAWMTVAYSVVAVVMFAVIARGARAVGDEAAPAAAPSR